MAFNFSFDLESIEDYMGNHLKLFISLTIGLLVFVGLIALSVFLIAVRGKEQVMVPDVVGSDLTQALLELQEKDLFPMLQLRSTGNDSDRGLILEQDPEAGTIVKAERRINLVMSQGMALDKIGDYIGKNIGDVRAELASLRARNPQAAVTLREPFMYQYSPEPAGTVLQQNPEPDADITGSTTLELVVSRGPENTRIAVPDLRGLTMNQALERISQAQVDFSFTMRSASGDERPDTVIAQNPAAGQEIRPGSQLSVTLIAPVPGAGETVGIYRYQLPQNPYPLPVTIEAELPGGGRQRLAAVNHSGGEIAVPYRLPYGSTIMLSMLDREINRQMINQPVENLSLDQIAPLANP
ncbi:MAG: PASTA domain-containing protein [Treponema sp.]|jgi:beta-lactam-binding protein with PASTA domain|nr:PASTA domain-containing protein [Treponema sp.]